MRVSDGSVGPSIRITGPRRRPWRSLCTRVPSAQSPAGERATTLAQRPIAASSSATQPPSERPTTWGWSLAWWLGCARTRSDGALCERGGSLSRWTLGRGNPRAQGTPGPPPWAGDSDAGSDAPVADPHLLGQEGRVGEERGRTSTGQR